jgi:ATP-binding cassette subfamily F protein 3
VREEGYNVITSFFAQHQLEALNLNNEILEELKQAGTNKLEVELRTILGCFLFAGDDVYKKIKVLSGGEKSRVAMAKTLISEANFLLLDEPTNHLDMASVNILIQALQQYQGTFVVVSHDREFVANIANKIWYIEDYKIKEYPGTYYEYLAWKEEREEKAKLQSIETKPIKKENTPPTSKAVDSASKENQIKIKQATLKLDKIEKEILEFETQIKQVEFKLADAEIYQNPKKLEETQKFYSKLKTQLEQKQYEWDILAEEVQSLEKI